MQLFRSILRSIPFVLSVLVCRLLRGMQLRLFWTSRQVELPTSSEVLLMEYRLAGVLSLSEVLLGGVEVGLLQGREA